MVVQHWAILSKYAHMFHPSGYSHPNQGATKMAPHSSWLPRRDPVTIEHMWALHRHLDHTNAFDITVFTITCIAFWCHCRLGELINDASFNLKAHVSWSTKIMWGTASNELKYIHFDIPHTKNKANGNCINISDSTCDCSTTWAFKHHMATNIDIPPNAPLFAFEMADKSWSPMKRNWFMDHCNEVWLEEGLSSAKGHGFHIGGTTHLLLLSMDPWIVMAQGQWSSQSFLGYWQKCKEILSLFIGFSFQSCKSILTTMSSHKNHLTGK